MVRNLRELKEEQQQLRDELIEICKDEQVSMLRLSKIIGLPYTTLRQFMMGYGIAMKNIWKIKDWLGTRPTS